MEVAASACREELGVRPVHHHTGNRTTILIISSGISNTVLRAITLSISTTDEVTLLSTGLHSTPSSTMTTHHALTTTSQSRIKQTDQSKAVVVAPTFHGLDVANTQSTPHASRLALAALSCASRTGQRSGGVLVCSSLCADDVESQPTDSKFKCNERTNERTNERSNERRRSLTHSLTHSQPLTHPKRPFVRLLVD